MQIICFVLFILGWWVHRLLDRRRGHWQHANVALPCIPFYFIHHHTTFIPNLLSFNNWQLPCGNHGDWDKLVVAQDRTAFKIVHFLPLFKQLFSTVPNVLHWSGLTSSGVRSWDSWTKWIKLYLYKLCLLFLKLDFPILRTPHSLMWLFKQSLCLYCTMRTFILNVPPWI